MRRHKNDCLCAICVLRRQKRDREAKERLVEGQRGDNDESKLEVKCSFGILFFLVNICLFQILLWVLVEVRGEGRQRSRQCLE